MAQEPPNGRCDHCCTRNKVQFAVLLCHSIVMQKYYIIWAWSLLAAFTSGISLAVIPQIAIDMINGVVFEPSALIATLSVFAAALVLWVYVYCLMRANRG